MRTLIVERPPPQGRIGKCVGHLEQHLYEPAVMLAVAHWMFESGAGEVYVHLDGMHAKQIDICGRLRDEGFEKVADNGATREAGRYAREHQTLVVDFRPGQGDVVAHINGRCVVVEAKGGIINTLHAGQKSKLRKHLYEAVGMLLDGPDSAGRLIAAVPHHTETEKVAYRMAGQCRVAGIEIALISGDGDVNIVANNSLH